MIGTIHCCHGQGKTKGNNNILMIRSRVFVHAYSQISKNRQERKSDKSYRTKVTGLRYFRNLYSVIFCMGDFQQAMFASQYQS